MKGNTMFYTTGQIIRKTPKAILLSQSRGNTDGGDLEVWLPKSQIDGYKFTRDNEDEEIYIIVPEWLINAKDMDCNEADHPVFGLPVDLDEMEKITF
jgi:hypothetical protein